MRTSEMVPIRNGWEFSVGITWNEGGGSHHHHYFDGWEDLSMSVAFIKSRVNLTSKSTIGWRRADSPIQLESCAKLIEIITYVDEKHSNNWMWIWTTWEGASQTHQQFLLLRHLCVQVLVNWWFGARWFGFPGSPLCRGLLLRGTPIEFQTIHWPSVNVYQTLKTNWLLVSNPVKHTTSK